jgi:hypothetical protein
MKGGDSQQSAVARPDYDLMKDRYIPYLWGVLGLPLGLGLKGLPLQYMGWGQRGHTYIHTDAYATTGHYDEEGNGPFTVLVGTAVERERSIGARVHWMAHIPYTFRVGFHKWF